VRSRGGRGRWRDRKRRVGYLENERAYREAQAQAERPRVRPTVEDRSPQRLLHDRARSGEVSRLALGSGDVADVMGQLSGRTLPTTAGWSAGPECPRSARSDGLTPATPGAPCRADVCDVFIPSSTNIALRGGRHAL